jgi:ParB/RepB/Spo0J family partition protein
VTDNPENHGAQGAIAKSPKLKRLSVHQITVGNRQLDINEDNVLALMDSITKVGRLIQPIVVTCHGTGAYGRGAYQLKAGAHRLEACKRLGWEQIDVLVTDFAGRQGMLAEIDENLVRRDLSDAERAKLTAERKRIYELEHPETKKGAVNQHTVANRQNGEKHPDRFTKDTAKNTGRSERSVQRDAARGEALGPDVLDKIKGTNLDKGTELDALAKLPKEEQQALADRAKAGELVSAVEYLLVKQAEDDSAGLGVDGQSNTPPPRRGPFPPEPELITVVGLDVSAKAHGAASDAKKAAKALAGREHELTPNTVAALTEEALEASNAWNNIAHQVRKATADKRGHLALVEEDDAPEDTVGFLVAVAENAGEKADIISRNLKHLKDGDDHEAALDALDAAIEKLQAAKAKIYELEPEEIVIDPDGVEDVDVVLKNFMASVGDAKDVAESWRKVTGRTSFADEAAQQVNHEIDLLIRKWRTVQSAVNNGNEPPSGPTGGGPVSGPVSEPQPPLEEPAENATQTKRRRRSRARRARRARPTRRRSTRLRRSLSPRATNSRCGRSPRHWRAPCRRTARSQNS